MATQILCYVIWILALVSWTRGLDNYGHSVHLEIIGGNKTDIVDHSHQVSVWSGSEYRGSGAWLGDGWVITTASILIGFDSNSLVVRCDSSSAISGGILRRVSKVLIHHRFRVSHMTHDIALLKLTNFLLMDIYSRNNLILLPPRSLVVNSTALLSGWGSSSNHTKMSDVLLQTTMRAVSNPECQQAYMDDRVITSSQFCARAVDVYGPCWGDRGDLLVRGRILYGLLSWNRGCYNVAEPSVFTDISYFRGWVKGVIRRNRHHH